MAKRKDGVRQRIRVSDQIRLGVLAKTFPREQGRAVLTAQGKMSRRQRDLPAHVMVYSVIAMALYREAAYREVLWVLVEGISGLLEPEERVPGAGKAAISRARTRLGWEAVHQLQDQGVHPIAERRTRGAW